MTRNDDFIGQLEGYLEEYEGSTPLPNEVRDAIRAQLPFDSTAPGLVAGAEVPRDEQRDEAEPRGRRCGRRGVRLASTTSSPRISAVPVWEIPRPVPPPIPRRSRP